MVSVGKFEFDDWRIVHIDVSFFIVIFLDRLVWWLKLTNVNSSGTHVSMHEFSKGSEVIMWVFTSGEISPELLVVSILFLNFLSLLIFFSFCCFLEESMLILQFGNLLFIRDLLFCFLLHIVVF
jgi:hypothetical protein